MASFEESVKKIHDFYEIKPNAPIYQKEFGFYVLDRWTDEGYLKPRGEVPNYEDYLADLFGYDAPAVFTVHGLGWCEAGLLPAFEEKVLEDRGDHELAMDFAGRKVLYFKGRRNGFMPEYVEHPVKDMESWKREIEWRMDKDTPGRDAVSRAAVEAAKKGAERGGIVVQGVVGGYMYLRSLIGPEQLLYKFYDDPELIHTCMRKWLELADAVISRHQKELDFDELFFGEDICYNGGALISPDMMREFLFPYYKQLYENMKSRARDKSKKIHFQIDTDGNCTDVISLYRELGCDYMSPFEVAARNDLLALAKKYPDMRLSGGIDKRIIAEGGDALKRHIDAIMPEMRRRGGFIPTCDHGVPEETSFENYMQYRSLMKAY